MRHRSLSPLLLACGLLCAAPGWAQGRVIELPSGHVIDEQGHVVAGPAPVTGPIEPAPEAALLYRPTQPAARAPSATGVAAAGGDGGKPRRGPGVEMVIGGASEEGVAKTTTLPIIK